jgi:hypothetical protein
MRLQWDVGIGKEPIKHASLIAATVERHMQLLIGLVVFSVTIQSGMERKCK